MSLLPSLSLLSSRTAPLLPISSTSSCQRRQANRICPRDHAGPRRNRCISRDVAGNLHYRYIIYIVRIYRWKEEKIRWNGRTTSEVGAGVEVSNPAGERLRTRVLHQSIIKAMSVLSSREKSFVPLFAAGASAAPRKIQFRARDEYAWNREIQQEWGGKYRYRFLMGRAKTRVRISDKWKWKER